MVETPEQRRERDKRRIDDPQSWPMMRLPLKNPSRFNSDRPHLGFLICGFQWDTEKRVVTLASIFFDDPDKPPRTEEYASTDALLGAGWLVD